MIHAPASGGGSTADLTLVLRDLVGSKEAWPKGLLIRFEGSILQVDDKVLFVRLIETADDRGVARLIRPLDESTWQGVQQSAERLAGSPTLLRGYEDDEKLLSMINSHRADSEGIEVSFDLRLLAMWRNRELAGHT